MKTAEQLNDGLSALFSDLSGVPVDACGIDDEEFTFPADDDTDAGADGDTHGTGGPVTLGFTIDGLRALGRDELRGGYDPNATIAGDTYVIPPTDPAYDPDNPSKKLGGYVYVTSGNRIVTITIKIEAHNQKIPAWEYAERLRSKLNLPSARARLYALDLARNVVSNVHNVSYPDDEGRPVSAYAVELVCNTSTNFADVPVTTIEQVDVRPGTIGGS